MLGAGMPLGSCAAQQQQKSKFSVSPSDPESMAADLLATPRADVADLGLDWLAKGATPRDLLGAAYLAGLHEVNPSPIGGQVHAMMMVPSAAAATGVLRGKHRWVPALFNLDRVKRSQGRDASANRGDWTMPPAPEPEDRPAHELVRTFETAMTDWDVDAADRAAVSLQRVLSLSDFFEVLWPWAARDFRIIGHKMIYASQSYRALQDLGWRLGRDGVRSLMFGILDQNPYGRFSAEESKHILGVYERNLERLQKFPQSWRIGGTDPAASFALLERFRDCDADAAAGQVVASLQNGVTAARVWDGIRLWAFEILMRRPNIAGVHGVTSLNALHCASLYTTRERTRRLLLLQAASWMPMFAPILEKRRPFFDVRIDALTPRGNRPFEQRDAASAAAAAMATFDEDGLRSFRDRAVDRLARKAGHDHDYKFTLAALEEIEAAHPACRPALAGAAMYFLRRDDSADRELWSRVQRESDK